MSHHNESSNASDQNIEITLCSSRLEDDTASLVFLHLTRNIACNFQPQPDVSPLTEEEADKDTTAPFHHDPQEGGFQESERPCLEERVPHLHYNPPKLSASNLMHDDNFVDGGTEGESDGEPEIITENVAPLNIITVDENDVEVQYCINAIVSFRQMMTFSMMMIHRLVMTMTLMNATIALHPPR